jgi:phosphoribosylformylglycinamidine synthase
MDSTLILVGQMDNENLGGSIYFDTLNERGGKVPEVDLENLPKVLTSIHDAIDKGVVKSCKTVGYGGLSTTIAMMCFGGECGAEINVSDITSRADISIFSETAGCFVVEVDNGIESEKYFSSVPHVILGKTTADKKLKIKDGNKDVIDTDIDELKKVWKEPFNKILN